MIYFIITIITIMTIVVYASYFNMKIYSKNEKYTKLDKDTTNIYLKQLKTMIEYETIYEVDSTIGKQMALDIGASPDIPNDELYDMAVKIQNKIITNMSDNMKTFLFDSFGELWIYDFIKIYTISMILNYANLSISSITIAKK